ncbi:MAG: 50S ribosomal protein L3 [Patescibacteria group bacterium]
MDGFILGEKSIQSQTFDEKGERVPTTFIKTSPCFIIAIKTPSKDGYGSIQLGFRKVRKIKKPILGRIKKAGITTPLQFLREFRLDKHGSDVQFTEESGKTTVQIGEKKFTVGQEIKPADMFAIGNNVAVSGTTKGKGFQGAVKRHGFKGGSKTHGQSDRQRAPGSIGMTTTPGRVFKGKRMAGRMGGERVTVFGLRVIELTDTGFKIKGLVPGSMKGLLEVRMHN